MRPLASSDYTRSHLAVLAVLTQTPDPGVDAYKTQFTTMRNTPNTYFTIVIVNKQTDQIVGVGCVFMERKFLRNLGSVGHIEDIAVDKKVQGAKLGLRIIQALTAISEAQGAYKTILNCSTDNIRESLLLVLHPYDALIELITSWTAFYQKCGYAQKEHEMVRALSTTEEGAVNACPDVVMSHLH